MRYFWPIARLVFCPLSILFIYLKLTDPLVDKQQQPICMQQWIEVINLKSSSIEGIFEV